VLLQDCFTPLHLQYFVTACAVLKGITWLLQDGDTALHAAAGKEHTEVVEQLLAAGAAVDATSQVRPTRELGRWGLTLGLYNLYLHSHQNTSMSCMASQYVAAERTCVSPTVMRA
jgi:hypothetical protein